VNSERTDNQRKNKKNKYQEQKSKSKPKPKQKQKQKQKQKEKKQITHIYLSTVHYIIRFVCKISKVTLSLL
jgi:hypothetical protein